MTVEKSSLNPVKLTAKIRLQAALMLARDIQAFRGGDTIRFRRQIDRHGKQLLTLEKAQRNINEIINGPNAKAYFPATCRALGTWLKIAFTRLTARL